MPSFGRDKILKNETFYLPVSGVSVYEVPTVKKDISLYHKDNVHYEVGVEPLFSCKISTYPF